MQSHSHSNKTPSVAAENPWLFCPEQRPSARLRLICFPYAGGNAGVFRSWANYFNEDIELVAIQYPGRATRFKEALLPSMEELVGAIFESCSDFLCEKPFVLFGHSMGASVVWELSHQLRKKNLRMPEMLIVSGRRAPSESLPEDYKMIHSLPKNEFLERLKTLNGTPEELLEHKDLMELMEPVIRNDFKLIETWSVTTVPKLNLPIEVLGGEDDKHLDKMALKAWEKESSKTCNISLMPGDHFYLHQHEKVLMKKLNELLNNI